jgi:hypothetical protein
MNYYDNLLVTQRQHVLRLEAQQHELVRQAQSKSQPDLRAGIVSRLVAAIPGRRPEQRMTLNTRRAG